MIEKNMMDFPRVMIVLVNWNRPQDTLACLDSLRGLNYPDYFVVVCDNGSQDGSVENFRAWAAAKKVAYRKFAETEIELLPIEIPEQGSLTCIGGEVNRGFAAANNWALKYAMRLSDVQYVWLLNNDTVVDSAALGELVEVSLQDAVMGLCGSTVLRMDKPNIVQCLCGGRYNVWTGWTRHIGDGTEWNTIVNHEKMRCEVENELDFVYGASMLVSRSFLQEVGLMSEDYFLYFEELDWAKRAQGRFRKGYAPGSLVWHKEGASTLSVDKKKSKAADYYMIRNRVLFTLRYCRRAIVFIFAGLLVTLANRLLRGQAGRIPLLARAAADGVKAARK